MQDFVVYHNPDEMGELDSSRSELRIVTNKRVRDVIGDRVWLITAKDRPRKFYLCSWFIVGAVEDAQDEGFTTRLRGSHGQNFHPTIPIPNEEWFQEFKKNQGNFAFGFQKISNSETIERLEELAGLNN